MAQEIKAALLRKKQVMAVTSLSSSSIYERIAKKTFPPQVRVGARSVAWRAVDIEAWLADPAGYIALETK